MCFEDIENKKDGSSYDYTERRGLLHCCFKKATTTVTYRPLLTLSLLVAEFQPTLTIVEDYSW